MTMPAIMSYTSQIRGHPSLVSPTIAPLHGTYSLCTPFLRTSSRQRLYHHHTLLLTRGGCRSTRKQHRKLTDPSSSLLQSKRQESCFLGVSRFRGYYRMYWTWIQQRPVVTKSLTCGILSFVGDVFSQLVSAHTTQSTFIFHPLRSMAFLLSGTLFVGPYIHFWYQALWTWGRHWQSTWNISKARQVLYLNILDQTIGVLLFFPLYFYIHEVVEACISLRIPNIQAATYNLQKDLIPVLWMQYRVWPLANWINFTHVPEPLRVLVSNLVAVLWNIYLCSKVGSI